MPVCFIDFLHFVFVLLLLFFIPSIPHHLNHIDRSLHLGRVQSADVEPRRRHRAPADAEEVPCAQLAVVDGPEPCADAGEAADAACQGVHDEVMEVRLVRRRPFSCGPTSPLPAAGGAEADRTEQRVRAVVVVGARRRRAHLGSLH